jgi:NAD(P)-dependent dehydrogenase (short-subunit alcohol dehydrogenase family)
MVQLDGAVALVTGGASGIGAASARALAARGTRVVVGDVDAEGGKAVAAEVDGVFIGLDVSDLEQNRAAVALAESTYGRLDLVHLNAGLGTAGMSLGEEFDPVRYRRLVDVNLDGVVFGIHAALPAFRRAGGGAVLATASLSGLTPFAGDPLYAATKSAVVWLARSLAEPLSVDNVTITALCPGFTDTPLVAPMAEAFRTAGFPLLTSEEVAEAGLAALASGGTGEAWLIQPGRPAEPYRFRGVPAAAQGSGEHLAPPPTVMGWQEGTTA